MASDKEVFLEQRYKEALATSKGDKESSKKDRPKPEPGDQSGMPEILRQNQ